MSCTHENFDSKVEADKVVNPKGEEVGFHLKLTIWCSDCKQPFEFPGIPEGLSSIEARVSKNHQMMITPIKPADWPHFNYWTYSQQELPV